MEITGLTSKEVRERTDKGLSNQYAAHKTKTYREITVENIFSLFNLITFSIIIFVITFYIRNNDERLLLDSIGILFIAITNTGIALFQEIKSKKALDKVNLLLKREVIVIREGKKQSIDQTKVVVDDIIEIVRGDQIIVDGIVIGTKRLEIDESLLTGESIPIEKSTGDTVLSGSFCVSGNGYYKAVKVGIESHANKVTNLAKKFKFSLTPLQKRINFILKVLFGIALLLVLIEILVYNLETTHTYTFVEHIRKIATILISLVPQGLVLTASVTFAIGVYRISKIGAIVQKLNAIESFSNVEYVCMDKTGTLTENKLKVHSINSVIPNEKAEMMLGTFAFNSSEQNATIKAIEHLPKYSDAKYINEIPFSSEIKMSILELEIASQKRVFVFGGYDILLNKVNEPEKEKLESIFHNQNLSIYRNLLFGEIENIKLSEISQEELIGLIAIKPFCIVSISDTIRQDVLDAINLFKDNGIKFKILTGDSPEAVSAILKEIGWDVTIDEMTTGTQLDELNEKEFSDVIFNKTLFARLKPEHKLKIIKTFKSHKKHVAMIGDGVNDLPAIKQADIGIAMEEGSAITKEVADIVLLKNKFSLLPEIFDEGNKIVNSVNAISKLFLTKNFLVIYLTLASLLSLLDFPLTPRRVSLLNIFSIGLPAFIITLKNNNTHKCRNFVKDVFSFVLTSSTLMLVGTYFSQIFISKFVSIPKPELDMALMTVLIILSVINFFIVSSESGERKNIYYIYGTFLIVLFVFLAGIKIDTYILNLLRTFYEIIHLNFKTWIVIFILTALISAILIITHRIRERMVTNK